VATTSFYVTFSYFIISNNTFTAFYTSGGNLRERDHWGDPDADGRIILRWIFRNWEGFVGTGWSWIRIGTGGGHL